MFFVFFILAFYALLALLPQGSLPHLRMLGAVPAALIVMAGLVLVMVATDGFSGLRNVCREVRQAIRGFPDMLRDLREDVQG